MTARTCMRLCRGGLALGALYLAALGCAPPWTVVRQASPNPFLSNPAFVIEPLSYEGMSIGGQTEAAYSANWSPKDHSDWQADKTDSAQNYLNGAMGNASGVRVRPAAGGEADKGAFRVRARVSFWEPGFYAVVAARSSQMSLIVEILDPGGQVMDHFETSASVGSSITTPASGQRMRMAGSRVGEIVAEYLRQRVHPSQ